MQLRTKAALIGVAATGALLLAGPLDPPGGAPSPTMKTLEQVEPRTAVNSDNTPGDATAMFVIADPGSYYVTRNLAPTSGVQAAIRIDASDVTLDLKGFRLDGAGNGPDPAVAVFVGANSKNVEIRDGVLINWTLFGVSTDADTVTHLRGLRVRDCAVNGLLIGAGTVIDCRVEGGAFGIGAGPEALVQDCQVRDSTSGSGIQVSDESVVRGCDVREIAGNGIRASALDLVVEDNVVEDVTGAGIFMPSGVGATIRDNVVTGCGTGLEITFNNPIHVTNNIIRRNATNYDLPVAADSQLRLELLISDLPVTLEWPCTATVTGRLIGANAANGITIASDDVTIDLGGHALVGAAGSLDGIATSGAHNNITIRNGAVRDWEGQCIDLTTDNTAAGVRHRIENCSVSGAGTLGIWCGAQSVVRNSSTIGCGTRGILAGARSRLEWVDASQNSVGMTVGAGSIIRNCTADANENDGVSTSSGSVIVDSAATGNGRDGFDAAPGSVVRNCAATGNVTGIRAHERVNVIGCTVTNSVVRGIECNAGSRIAQNVLGNNPTGVEVVDPGARVDSNTISGQPGQVGVDALGDTLVVRNWVYGLNTPFDLQFDDVFGPLITGASGDLSSITNGDHPWANISVPP